MSCFHNDDRGKDNLHFDNQMEISEWLPSFSHCFLKGIENIFSVLSNFSVNLLVLCFIKLLIIFSVRISCPLDNLLYCFCRGDEISITIG